MSPSGHDYSSIIRYNSAKQKSNYFICLLQIALSFLFHPTFFPDWPDKDSQICILGLIHNLTDILRHIPLTLLLYCSKTLLLSHFDFLRLVLTLHVTTQSEICAFGMHDTWRKSRPRQQTFPSDKIDSKDPPEPWLFFKVCLLVVAKKNTKRALSCRANSVQLTTCFPGVCIIFCPPSARARINTNKQVG